MLGWDFVLTLGIILFLLWCIVSVYRDFFYKEDKSGHKYIIVIVKNQERVIEGIIRRGLIMQRKYARKGQLIIVDLDSEDQTRDIIVKMAYPENYFSLVTLTSFNELNDFLTAHENESLVLNYLTLDIKKS